MFYKCITIFIFFSFHSLNSNAEKVSKQEAKLFRRYINDVTNQHRTLVRVLEKTIKNIPKKESEITESIQTINKDYLMKISLFRHLSKNDTSNIYLKFQDAESHNAIINLTYAKLMKFFSNENVAFKNKREIYKRIFYSKGRKLYGEKNFNKGVINKIHDLKLRRLKENLVLNHHKLDNSLNGIKQHKISVPNNFQTNNEVNKIFQFDYTQKLKERKDNAIINNQFYNLDSQRVFQKTKDTTLNFKVNPYQLMPFISRIKVGFDNQLNRSNVAFLRTNSVIRFSFLLHPNFIPNLSVGFSSSVFIKDEVLRISEARPLIRLGGQMQVSRSIWLFLNYEKQANNLTNEDGFILGITNNNPNRKKLSFWFGINANNLITNKGQILIYRIGI
ncbi:MAG: hypothetical protein MUC81_11935 [Bacteroidia bacterium]|nr:hypothetical protein [Bacteroidia bacterium]